MVCVKGDRGKKVSGCVVGFGGVQGGYGAIALAKAVQEVCKEGKADFKLLYPDSMT